VILFELTETEDHPLYQDLAISNGNRQYDFLRSIVTTCIGAGKLFVSQHVIKALNFQAITCLHTTPGEYRPCQVYVGNHTPPPEHRVQALMDDFVNTVNRNWEKADPVVLAAYVLWRLNYIHPFINGNGRTARATAYFVLCVKLGYWLPGTTILPELISRERARYVEALRSIDESVKGGNLNLTPLHALLSELVAEQLASAGAGDVPENVEPAPEELNANVEPLGGANPAEAPAPPP
jgi:prophage maintenance system killer protein